MGGGGMFGLKNKEFRKSAGIENEAETAARKAKEAGVTGTIRSGKKKKKARPTGTSLTGDTSTAPTEKKTLLGG
tara:strand:- start:46 stop:267 length:222 start_codon:yes stop_codon:yes gene_type:complete